VELSHPGINADLRSIEGEISIAPSAVPRKDGLIPRALSREEVKADLNIDV